jgi:hypothetical protein
MQENFNSTDLIVSLWMSPLHAMSKFQLAHPDVCAIVRYETALCSYMLTILYRYEDLISQPTETLMAIAQYIGVDSATFNWDGIKSKLFVNSQEGIMSKIALDEYAKKTFKKNTHKYYSRSAVTEYKTTATEFFKLHDVISSFEYELPGHILN